VPYFWLPRSELPERSRKSCSVPNSRSEKRTRRVGLGIKPGYPGKSQRMILRLGNACISFFTPVSVT
jgi:hypothetical protein